MARTKRTKVEQTILYWTRRAVAEGYAKDHASAYAVACYLAEEAKINHDPSKSKLTTHVFTVLRNRMARELRKEQGRLEKAEFCYDPVLTEQPTYERTNDMLRDVSDQRWEPEQCCAFREGFAALSASVSEDAFKVMDLLLSFPGELLRLTESGAWSPRLTRGALVERAKEEYGGVDARWYKAMKELKTAVAVHL